MEIKNVVFFSYVSIKHKQDVFFLESGGEYIYSLPPYDHPSAPHGHPVEPDKSASISPVGLF